MTMVLCANCDAMVPLPGPGTYDKSNWPKCARCSGETGKTYYCMDQLARDGKLPSGDPPDKEHP